MKQMSYLWLVKCKLKCKNETHKCFGMLYNRGEHWSPLVLVLFRQTYPTRFASAHSIILAKLQYKRYVYPVVNNLDIQTVDKIQYLTNLATIEELQGNYRIARMLLKEKFDLLIALENKKDSDLFETTMQLAKLAKLQNDFQNLESVLLQALENAIGNDNAKQIADILLELALLPEIKTNYQKSMEYLSRGLVSADRIGYKIGAIDILVGKASICVLHKRFTEAKTSLKEAWDLAMNINDRQRIEEIRKQQQSLGVIMDKKIFISYNQTDRIFVKKLAEDLQTAGLLVWWDEWEIKVGDSIVEKVSNGISTSAYLIVVLSPSSVSSPWVQREVNSATMKQLANERDITILPVLLKDCDIPILLTDIRWADFRKSYKSGKAELLKALK